MRYQKLHDWDLTPVEAVALQNRLRHQVRIEQYSGTPRLIAGADISHERLSDVLYAGFVVLDARTLDVVDHSSAVAIARFPYIPGLLTFREGPALLAAWERLRVEPDVVVFDGQGIAHPRRMGIASHMGLFIRKPSIGCGKTLLTGSYGELPHARGATADLRDSRGSRIGVALRTRDRVGPVFVSPGHLIDVESAVRILLMASGKYRIPEPTRKAHIFVNSLRREARESA